MFSDSSFNSRFGALGDAVHRGDALYWAGTVASIGDNSFYPWLVSSTWGAKWQQFLSLLQGEGFTITKSEQNEDAKSLAVNVIAPGDFGDINDVKGLISGIAGQVGFQLRASMIQAGPRNLSTPGPSPWSDPLGTAGDFWGGAISSGAGSFWNTLTGSDSGNNGLLLAAGLGLVLLLVLGRR